MINLTTEQKAALYDSIRPEIRKLAHQMEIKFRMHDNDRGDPFECIDSGFIDGRLSQESGEFYNAVSIFSPPSKVWAEEADCCNFRLMRIIAYENEWKNRASRTCPR